MKNTTGIINKTIKEISISTEIKILNNSLKNKQKELNNEKYERLFICTKCNTSFKIKNLEIILVYTGQHDDWGDYDESFQKFQINCPDCNKEYSYHPFYHKVGFKSVASCVEFCKKKLHKDGDNISEEFHRTNGYEYKRFYKEE